MHLPRAQNRRASYKASLAFAVLAALAGTAMASSRPEEGGPPSGSPLAIGSIAEARSLPVAKASLHPPADFEATVAVWDYIAGDKPYQVLYLQDGGEGIYANCHGAALNLAAGQRIRVRGAVAPGLFAPEILDPVITPIGFSPAPLAPAHPRYEELSSGKYDCRWIELEGIVRAETIQSRRLAFRLAFGAAKIPVAVAGEPGPSDRSHRMVDARVRIRGACRTFFNSQRQLIDIGVYCPSLDSFEILEPAAEPAAMPLVHAADLLTYNRGGEEAGHRVRLRGIVTCQAPGSIVYTRDEERGLMIRTAQKEPLQPGDVIEALGFPTFSISTPYLDDASYRVIEHGKPVQPVEISPADASSGKFEATLVSLKARVVEDSVRGSQRILWLQNGDAHFQALQQVSEGAGRIEPCPSESEVVVSGICMAHGPLLYRNDTGWLAPSFQILIPSASDVRILKRPSWWTLQRLGVLLAVVAACLCASAAWVGLLHKRVREQTVLIRERVREQAVLQERNRIARELHDTLAQGFAATAFQLEALEEELTGVSSKARRHFSMALTMVRHSLAEARRSVAGLRPEALARRDLPGALQASGESLVSEAGCAFEFRWTGALRSLPCGESDLLRIAQESVTNAVRHAGARKIWIHLDYAADALHMEIGDDGRGFDPLRAQASEGHFGLTGMSERANAIGARLKILSSPGAGAIVAIEFPYLCVAKSARRSVPTAVRTTENPAAAFASPEVVTPANDAHT